MNFLSTSSITVFQQREMHSSSFTLRRLALKSNFGFVLIQHTRTVCCLRHKKTHSPHLCNQQHQHRRLTSDAGVIIRNPQEERWRRFIEDNTEVSRDHLTPELALRLITPKCRLWSLPYDEEESKCDKSAGVTDPYWAFYWPGGQALTRSVYN